jgi:hypothetical protein
MSMTETERRAQERIHDRFVKALQHEPIPCGAPICHAHVETVELSKVRDRIKTFQFHCPECGWEDTISGREDVVPPWDDAMLLVMADEHLMHQQPLCPFDNTPIVFISLPNPRRRARYRLACFYCGRQGEMDWPPSESKR